MRLLQSNPKSRLYLDHPDIDHLTLLRDAFLRGMQAGRPYDRFRTVVGTNFIADSEDPQLTLVNKHQGVLFWTEGDIRPVRFVLADTHQLPAMLEAVLESPFEGLTIREYLQRRNIQELPLWNIGELPYFSVSTGQNETQVRSCGQMVEAKEVVAARQGSYEAGHYPVTYSACIGGHLMRLAHDAGFLDSSQNKLVAIQKSA